MWVDVLTHWGGTCQDQAVPGSGGPPLARGKLVQEGAPGVSVELEFDVSNIRAFQQCEKRYSLNATRQALWSSEIPWVGQSDMDQGRAAHLQPGLVGLCPTRGTKQTNQRAVHGHSLLLPGALWQKLPLLHGNSALPRYWNLFSTPHQGRQAWGRGECCDPPPMPGAQPRPSLLLPPTPWCLQPWPSLCPPHPGPPCPWPQGCTLIKKTFPFCPRDPDFGFAGQAGHGR